MYIQMSQKLRERLNVPAKKYQLDYQQEELYCWHGHFITLNRRKAIVLLNNASRYVILLWGVKANHLRNIEQHISEAIRETFLHEGVSPELVERYLQDAGPFYYGKTKNRSMQARMTQAVFNLETFFPSETAPDSLTQINLGK